MQMLKEPPKISADPQYQISKINKYKLNIY